MHAAIAIQRERQAMCGEYLGVPCPYRDSRWRPGSGRRTNGSGSGGEQTSVVARTRSHASPVCSEPPVSSELISKASPTWGDALNNGDVTKNFALFFVPCWQELKPPDDEPSGEVGWNELPSLPKVKILMHSTHRLCFQERKSTFGESQVQ